MRQEYIRTPVKTVSSVNRNIAVFDSQTEQENIDHSVVESFGEEWKKFYRFSDKDIETDALKYFDILTPAMLNSTSYAVDLGCGTGRWTKYLSAKAGFIEAIDPSDAIFVADKLIASNPAVRLTKASIENVPFADETFDFGMSIGVLHHIPDTQKAMNDCVKKIKIGGYFFTYLYYNFENRGTTFKILFTVVNGMRKVTSRLPMKPKKFVCDVIALVVYLPVVSAGRLLNQIGFKKISKKMPLSHYQANSFFWMRTDALDRFGTTLEQRFSRTDIKRMMESAGLDEIIFSDQTPYWHAVGKRIR